MYGHDHYELDSYTLDAVRMLTAAVAVEQLDQAVRYAEHLAAEGSGVLSANSVLALALVTARMSAERRGDRAVTERLQVAAGRLVTAAALDEADCTMRATRAMEDGELAEPHYSRVREWMSDITDPVARRRWDAVRRIVVDPVTAEHLWTRFLPTDYGLWDDWRGEWVCSACGHVTPAGDPLDRVLCRTCGGILTP
jgi:hypothetical protein